MVEPKRKLGAGELTDSEDEAVKARMNLSKKKPEKKDELRDSEGEDAGEEGEEATAGKKKTKFEKLRETVDPEVYKKWDNEQKFIRTKLTETDDFTWGLDKPGTLKYVGGVDISFCPDDDELAVSYLVVLSFPDLKPVYEDYEIVRLSMPYIPGFLAFREAAHLVKLVEKLKANQPEKMPQLIMVDGNGILHQNGCGLASHLGMLIDLPTVGCGKTIFFVDGLHKDRVLAQAAENNKKGGDYVELKGDSGRVWGAALRSTTKSSDPIIVSVGHKISLKTAVDVVVKCCKHRIPEPVRLADLTSRKVVKEMASKGDVEPVENTLRFLTEEAGATA